MAWIKRNLALVISGGISLCLLGFGGWYLWSALQKNEQVDNDIGQAKTELETLMNEKPFPSPSNINRARIELAQVNAFTSDARKQFPPSPPIPGPLNNLSFKVFLQTNIDELNHEAASLGVKVDLTTVQQGFSNFYYTFEAQRLPVNFAPQTLHPLAERLRDIKDVVTLLFKAKINRLEGIRRSLVEGETATPPESYLPEGPHAHPEAGVVSWPYEFTFHSFSGELGTVMDELAHTPECWVVRSVVVEPAEAWKPPVLVTNVARRGAAPAMQTVLQERVLKIVLKVDVIRSETEGPPSPGGGRRNKPPLQPPPNP